MEKRMKVFFDNLSLSRKDADRHLMSVASQIVNYELSIMNYQLWIINCELSIVNYQLWIINFVLKILNLHAKIRAFFQTNWNLVGKMPVFYYFYISLIINDLSFYNIWNQIKNPCFCTKKGTFLPFITYIVSTRNIHSYAHNIYSYDNNDTS